MSIDPVVCSISGKDNIDTEYKLELYENSEIILEIQTMHLNGRAILGFKQKNIGKLIKQLQKLADRKRL
jgi:hypothetical protein